MPSALASVASVVVPALIGGLSSRSAAKTAAKGQEEALQVSEAAKAEAKLDVNRLFSGATKDRSEAFARTLEFLSKAPGRQIAPFQRGNILAQEQVSRGLPQIQSAILGLPTDLSGFTARDVGTDFDIPLPERPAPAPPVDPQAQTLADLIGRIRGGIGGNFSPGGAAGRGISTSLRLR